VFEVGGGGALGEELGYLLVEEYSALKGFACGTKLNSEQAAVIASTASTRLATSTTIITTITIIHKLAIKSLIAQHENRQPHQLPNLTHLANLRRFLIPNKIPNNKLEHLAIN
jgi:hypothetical protein